MRIIQVRLSCPGHRSTGQKVFKTEEKDFQGRFKRNDRGRMMDRSRELVPNNCSQERERALTTGLFVRN